MGTITGIGGRVANDSTIVNCVRTWGITHPSAVQEAVCSATRGGRLRHLGNQDWTGNYTAYGHTPAFMPGDIITFNGAIGGADAATFGVSGQAMVDSVTINWDQEGGTLLNHSVAFSGNGPLTKGTFTLGADDAIPTPQPSLGLKVESSLVPAGGVPGAFTEIHEVRTAALTLSRDNVAYVASGTEGWNNRAIGNFDASLVLSCYAHNTTGWSAFPQPNEVHQFRVYVDEGKTQAWDLQWMIINDLSGMDVDIEGNALVGCTINAQMNGFWNPNGTPAVGEIKDPAATTIWPT